VGLALLLGATLAAPTGFNISAAEKTMEGIFRQSGVPSLTYAIVKDGKVVKSNSFGRANIETEAKATRKTVYEIGSMTKQFTAAGILLLAEEGKLTLEDPISKHLDNLPEAWRGLTIRQCLSHTAGLKDYLATYSPLKTDPVKASDVFKKMGAMTLDFAPQASWSYSNTGYLIATEILEKLSRQTYSEFMQARIFKPLGMKSTSVSDPDRVIPNRARGYSVGTRGLQNAPVINPSLASGAGNLVSNVDDLALWEASLQTNKLLKPESLKQFFAPVRLTNGRSSEYSIGWWIRQDKDRPIIEHGGNTVGFSSDLFRLPKENVSMIVLTNTGGVSGAQWARAGLAALLPSYDPKLRSEPDPNERETALMMLTLRKWGKGKYDTSNFTEDFKSNLNTTRGLAMRFGLASIGKDALSCKYLDGETVDGFRNKRFKFKFPGAVAIMELTFAPDGKIANLGSIYSYAEK
jgi:CubicO group peptidase (beta-lactamase class C family)